MKEKKKKIIVNTFGFCQNLSEAYTKYFATF